MISRKVLKVKICAAPKRERSVEEAKRTRIFNPQNNSEIKCARRSEDSNILRMSTNENVMMPSTSHSKSISLPASPNVNCGNHSAHPKETKKCDTSDVSTFHVEASSEEEKILLTKLRDELRNSPLLRSIVSEQLSKPISNK